MDLFLLDDLQAFYSVRCLKHLIALAPQIDLNTFPDLLVILNDQNVISFHDKSPFLLSNPVMPFKGLPFFSPQPPYLSPTQPVRHGPHSPGGPVSDSSSLLHNLSPPQKLWKKA